MGFDSLPVGRTWLWGIIEHHVRNVWQASNGDQRQNLGLVLFRTERWDCPKLHRWWSVDNLMAQ